jgi:hypothetical protein
MSRTPLFSWCCRALAVSGVAALAACGGSSKPAAQQSAHKLKVSGANVELRLAAIDVESAGPSKQLDDATKTAVMTQTREYVSNAVVQPMLTGKPQNAFGTLFSPNVQGAAVGVDRKALTDDSVGKVNGPISAPSTPVILSALVLNDGSVPYIATDFDLNLSSKLQSQPLSIKRHVELTFQKSGAKWLVTAYRVTAVRNVAGQSSTTTTTRKP